MPSQVRVDTETALPLQTVENHWYRVFKKYDTDGDGKLNLGELKASITSNGFNHDIPDHAVTKLIKLSDKNRDGHIDFAEFIHLLETDEGRAHFNHLLSQYIHYTVPVRSAGPRRRAGVKGRRGADSPDGEYEDEYSCFPPPLCMVLVSVIEIAVFAYDMYLTGDSIFGPAADFFIYNPFKRSEFWRFLTYMFVHAGIGHLVVNLMVQIMLGIPLEMVHGWWRVLAIYVAGVIAGSLGTSISDPKVYLAGASGGVYAIIAAHLSTIILNWSEMQFAIWQLLIFLALAVIDIGTAIHDRYVAQLNREIGYVAHLAGAIAGLLVGLVILRNLAVRSWEQKLQWIGLFIYIALISVAVAYNVFS
ncbi:rhomboid-related protein 2 isoform X2 [Nilaparvata lugens]|nr:rhomboid-related protein 2 isoform X2 [Nilaparvata lugens]